MAGDGGVLEDPESGVRTPPISRLHRWSPGIRAGIRLAVVAGNDHSRRVPDRHRLDRVPGGDGRRLLGRRQRPAAARRRPGAFDADPRGGARRRRSRSPGAGRRQHGLCPGPVPAGRAGNPNLVFSPASISTALAMTFAGARGQTETEMADRPALQPAPGPAASGDERADRGPGRARRRQAGRRRPALPPAHRQHHLGPGGLHAGARLTWTCWPRATGRGSTCSTSSAPPRPPGRPSTAGSAADRRQHQGPDPRWA